MILPHIVFGAFMSPLHPPAQDATILFQQDMAAIETLDRLGYKEAWIGEHHTGGWGTIACPEMFIAAALERTRQIRLGTGVVSLPYHHPFMVANRAVQLNRMGRGRTMLGVGAGSFPGDAYILGIDPRDARRRTQESLECILDLLCGESVTMETDWFQMNDARLHVLPEDQIEIAISSAASPLSMQLAGRTGIAPLSFAAPRPGGSAPDLRRQWQYAEESAAAAGRTVDRRAWRIVLNVVVAESDSEAREVARRGCMRWMRDYYGKTLGLPLDDLPVERGQEIDYLADTGAALVGDPDTVSAALAELYERAGGFGHALITVNDWMSPSDTERSLELFARYVRPRFAGRQDPACQSMDWAASRVGDFAPGAIQALKNAFAAAGAPAPDLAAAGGVQREG